jgi:hypothetical protein
LDLVRGQEWGMKIRKAGLPHRRKIKVWSLKNRDDMPL